MTGLVADLHVARPGFALDLSLTAAPGEVVALLGPNGAGKTTALRALAGLQDLSAGAVHLDGTRVDGLPPEQRRVGYVPQDGLLLPHLSARDNVAYGLRARGVRKGDARRRADEELDRLALGPVAAARPQALSGGQAQRVALARALVTEPALLLLDEPLAALDALTRTRVRTELKARVQRFPGPTVVVTHDLLDALVLADRLVVVEEGRTVQEGPPLAVTRRPRTDYVAGLVGLVLLRGTAAAGQVDVGGAVLAADAPDGPVLVAFAPEAVVLSDAPHDRGWPVTVAALEQQGTTTRVLLDGRPSLTAAVPAARLAELALAPGRRLWAAVPPDAVEVYA